MHGLNLIAEAMQDGKSLLRDRMQGNHRSFEFTNGSVSSSPTFSTLTPSSFI